MSPEDYVLMKKPRGTTAHCVSKVRAIEHTKIVSLLFTAVNLVIKINR